MALCLRRVSCETYSFQVPDKLLLGSIVFAFRRFISGSESAMNTADLSDEYNDVLQYVEPNLFRNFGGRLKFGGKISTVKCHEDNVLVKKALSEDGNKRVRGIILQSGLDLSFMIPSYHWVLVGVQSTVGWDRGTCHSHQILDDPFNIYFDHLTRECVEVESHTAGTLCLMASCRVFHSAMSSNLHSLSGAMHPLCEVRIVII